jgi:hypothetical protein
LVAVPDFEIVNVPEYVPFPRIIRWPAVAFVSAVVSADEDDTLTTVVPSGITG